MKPAVLGLGPDQAEGCQIAALGELTWRADLRYTGPASLRTIKGEVIPPLDVAHGSVREVVAVAEFICGRAALVEDTVLVPVDVPVDLDNVEEGARRNGHRQRP